MKKNYSVILVFTLVLSSLTSSFALSSPDEYNELEISTIEETVLDNGVVKTTTILNDGTEVILYVDKISMNETKIYDCNYELIATITESITKNDIIEPTIYSNKSIVDPLDSIGSWFSTSSYYTQDEYNYVGDYERDIKFNKAIGYITLNVMAAVINVNLPVLGNIFTAALKASDLYDIYSNNNAVYFYQEIYNHEYLGSLEQMYKTKMYFQDNQVSPFGNEETSYKHFG